MDRFGLINILFFFYYLYANTNLISDEYKCYLKILVKKLLSSNLYFLHNMWSSSFRIRVCERGPKFNKYQALTRMYMQYINYFNTIGETSATICKYHSWIEGVTDGR